MTKRNLFCDFKDIGTSGILLIYEFEFDRLRNAGNSSKKEVELPAYFSMNFWLQNFAYRIDMGALTFIFAGLATITIALATVSYQAIKAALANPVESLRCE